jgi:hypothetical protein
LLRMLKPKLKIAFQQSLITVALQHSNNSICEVDAESALQIRVIEDCESYSCSCFSCSAKSLEEGMCCLLSISVSPPSPLHIPHVHVILSPFLSPFPSRRLPLPLTNAPEMAHSMAVSVLPESPLRGWLLSRLALGLLMLMLVRGAWWSSLLRLRVVMSMLSTLLRTYAEGSGGRSVRSGDRLSLTKGKVSGAGYTS